MINIGYLLKPNNEIKSNSYNVLNFLKEDYEKAQSLSSKKDPLNKLDFETTLKKLNAIKKDILAAVELSQSWGKFTPSSNLQIVFTY